MADTARLHIENVYKRYGERTILDNIDLRVAKGELCTVVGPSGCGKSTLLRIIIGQEQASAGTVLIDGKPVELPDAHRGIVYQKYSLYPHLTALDNITLAVRKVLGKAREASDEIGMRALKRVGLIDKTKAFPNELSGGQQQRVAIARALALEPSVMLFDEPTSALDPELVGSVLNVMREMRESGMTMLVVSHEMRFARSAADRVVFMDGGKILEQGPPEQILNAPAHPRIREFIANIEAH